MMKNLKKFSLKSMLGQFGQSFKRFPISMLLTLLLGCYIIYLNHGGSLDFKKDFFFIFYPATGAVLGVALSLITEEFKNWKVAIVVQAVVHALWLVVSVYLAGFDRFSIPQLIAVTATVVAMSLAVFVACFYRKHQDVQFWNFSMRTLMSLIMSTIIGGILVLGLNLFLESLKMLFGIYVNNYMFGDIAAVCMTMLAPAMFMSIIPKGKNKHLDLVVEFSRFAKGVVQYLFIPLLLLYMATLYVYAAQILIQWTLPVGGVSLLVTVSMILMILLIYITYPIQHQEGNRLFKRVSRLLPVAMLPLLALMSVAIGRRLSDYGITVSRLYLLVFNLWCYAVCLWLIFTRNKRIWIIPTSFAVILLLISVGPQSIPNVTLNELKKEARSAFIASGLTRFPLTVDQYEAWTKQVDEKTAASIDSKLHYVWDFYKSEALMDLVEEDALLEIQVVVDDDESTSNRYEYYSNRELIQQMAIPAGFSHMEWITWSKDFEIDGDMMKIVLKPKNGQQLEFTLSLKALIALDQEKWKDESPKNLILKNNEAQLVINQFSLSINGKRSVDLDFEGLLFTK